jgi:ATP-dependent RNA helicase RhlB
MIDDASGTSQNDVPLPLPGTFRALNLPEVLLRATDELGFETCTEIQALTLPVIERGQDVAAQAQTGTGKTAAFILGGFARLLARESDAGNTNQPRMLVIAPTRELAIQIKKDADTLGAHSGLTSVVVYGGIDYDKQRRDLAKGTDVLIGTPGRLIDYFKQKIFDLKKLEIVVLDEADRMFDLGFIADIRYLLRRMPAPEKRLSMLFSATLSHRVMELAYEHMDNPEAVKTKSTGVTAKGVRQILYQPGTDEKVPLLLGLLDQLKPPRSIIFVNTKRAAETIESYLLGNDISCGTLSGDVRQSKRQRILADFTAGNLPVLIATDVAARGLHIDDVSHVFNYDLPQQAEDYVHRIGRTARAGSDGIAVSFACENYSFSLPDIQDYIGQSIPLEMITDELLANPKPAKRIVRERVPSRHGNKKKAHTGSSGKSPEKRTPRRTRDRRAKAKNKPDAQRPEQNVTKPSAELKTVVSGDEPKSDKASSKPRRRRRRRKPTSDSLPADTTDTSVSAHASDVSPKD